MEKLEKVAGKDGHRYVTLKPPEISPCLKQVKDEETRKKLYMAF